MDCTLRTGTRMERAARGTHKEKRLKEVTVHAGEETAVPGGSARVKKVLDVFSVVPPKRLQIMGRFETAKMRENCLYLKSSERL